MSGSLSWRQYESDHNVFYSIQVDKSNASLAAAFTGEILCKKRSQDWKIPPKRLILRRIHCRAQFNKNLTRSFVCGNPRVITQSQLEIGQEYLLPIGLTPGDNGVNLWLITGYTGEKFTNPIYYNQVDSGLDDGTQLDQ